jgi:tRNA threonylcarbamoyladenosine biosynthesis protein TsaE
MRKYQFKTLEEFNSIIKNELELINKYKLILLSGDLGAGKTTFVKNLGKILGYTQMINSPTYSIIQEYNVNEKLNIVHIDAYRVEQEDIGIDELLSDQKNIVLIEWSSKISDYLPLNNYLEIDIGLIGDTREIEFKEK